MEDPWIQKIPEKTGEAGPKDLRTPVAHLKSVNGIRARAASRSPACRSTRWKPGSCPGPAESWGGLRTFPVCGPFGQGLGMDDFMSIQTTSGVRGFA